MTILLFEIKFRKKNYFFFIESAFLAHLFSEYKPWDTKPMVQVSVCVCVCVCI